MNLQMTENEASCLLKTLLSQLRSTMHENRELRGQIEQLRSENECQRADVRILSDKYDELMRDGHTAAILEELQNVSEH